LLGVAIILIAYGFVSAIGAREATPGILGRSSTPFPQAVSVPVVLAMK
jgi:hypothetical protein